MTKYLPISFWGLHSLFDTPIRLFCGQINPPNPVIYESACLNPSNRKVKYAECFAIHCDPEIPNSHFLYGLHPIRIAEVAGTVTYISQSEGSSLILLDDGTGCVQVRLPQWQMASLYSPRLGDICIVTGYLGVNFVLNSDIKVREITRVTNIRAFAQNMSLFAYWQETRTIHKSLYTQPISYFLNDLLPLPDEVVDDAPTRFRLYEAMFAEKDWDAR